VPARRAKRRGTLRLVGTGVLAAGLAVVVGFWATDTWRVGGAEPPTLAGRAVQVPVHSVAGPPCRSPLTPDAPLRLWIGGDSLAGSLGPALGTMAGNTGVVQGTFDSRVSTGLSSPELLNWPQHASQQLPHLDPEATVFIIGANDWMVPQAQPTDARGQPVWEARYALLVAQMLDVLSANNRPVYWVGAPTMRDPRQDAGVRQVNEVARSVVQARPNATFVDAYTLFGDGQGRYSATLPGPTGKIELVRADDGVHLTDAGAARLARVLFAALDTRCRLTGQAVPDAPKQVIEVPGATQAPVGRGTSPAPTRPTPTTPPATSPPTTTQSRPPASTSPPTSGATPPRQ
jgi:hypothetical protein